MSVCPMLQVDILNEKVNAVVKATVTEVVKLQPLPALKPRPKGLRFCTRGTGKAAGKKKGIVGGPHQQQN